MALLFNSRMDYGTVTSDFGERDSPFNSGNREKHYGIDVSGEKGTDVTAKAEGIVVYSYDNGKEKFGYTVIIEHIGTDGKPFYVLHGHLNRDNRADVGQKVGVGDKIGEVGDSGKADGPHLHIEILIPDSYEIKNGKIYPYFGEGSLPINSSYYGKLYQDPGTGRIPTGIPGDINRKPPLEFDKWTEPKEKKQTDPLASIPGKSPSDLSSKTPPEIHPEDVEGLKRIERMLSNMPQEAVERTKREYLEEMEKYRKKKSKKSSSSGETLRRVGDKIYRVNADGSLDGYVKAWD